LSREARGGHRDQRTPTLDTATAARRAGVTTDSIRRWIRLGFLHPTRVGVGRRYRIDPDELAAVIDGSALATTDTVVKPTSANENPASSVRRDPGEAAS
jgi:excisionase family DNA binding protein